MSVIEHRWACPDHGVVADALASDYRCAVCEHELATVECVVIPATTYQGAVEALRDLLAAIDGLDFDGEDEWTARLDEAKDRATTIAGGQST